LWLQTVRRWPAELREEWEERAAIKEYCGSMPRAEAEREAVEELSSRAQRQAPVADTSPSKRFSCSGPRRARAPRRRRSRFAQGRRCT
jgi:hypothetical protein